jgi:hypothetical protein
MRTAEPTVSPVLVSMRETVPPDWLATQMEPAVAAIQVGNAPTWICRRSRAWWPHRYG